MLLAIFWRFSLTVADHVPIRREVRDLKDNYPAEWNLYLLGLRALFNINQSDPISYVGISGMFLTVEQHHH